MGNAVELAMAISGDGGRHFRLTWDQRYAHRGSRRCRTQEALATVHCVKQVKRQIIARSAAGGFSSSRQLTFPRSRYAQCVELHLRT